MSSLNQAILIGRIGRDPEIKTTTNGNTVANFTLATSEGYKDKASGEWKDKTEWHNIQVWGKLAEFAANHLKKGRQITVIGKIQTDSWEKEGVKHYKTSVIASQLIAELPPKNKVESAQTEVPADW